MRHPGFDAQPQQVHGRVFSKLMDTGWASWEWPDLGDRQGFESARIEPLKVWEKKIGVATLVFDAPRRARAFFETLVVGLRSRTWRTMNGPWVVRR
jgi:hypothetical protein